MKIQIEPHTLHRAVERGANEFEITDVLQSGVNILGKKGRLEKSKVFFLIVPGLGNITKRRKLMCIM